MKTAEEILAELRSRGWAVAVHNDYRLRGETYTFWLFTHPCGRWAKGEGSTDFDALANAIDQIDRYTLDNDLPEPYAVSHKEDGVLSFQFNTRQQADKFWKWVNRAKRLGDATSPKQAENDRG